MTDRQKSKTNLNIDTHSNKFNISSNEIKVELKRVNENIVFGKTLRSTIFILLVVAAIAILISTLFFPVLQIVGTSMTPTLNQGEYVILTKSNKFERGELCAFYWRNKVLVKRIIGFPGENINIDMDGNVYVNDKIIEENYLKEDTKSLGTVDIEFPYKVPEDQYFVLGDNRIDSIDSRVHEIGCIEKSRLVGKLLIRIWPLNKFGGIE